MMTEEEWLERFWARVDKTEDCWNWTGGRNAQGYGSVYTPVTKSTLRAHRVAYALLVGPIPDGMVIDHLCRNPSCVRPDHLEPVTVQQNVQRGMGPMLLGMRSRANPLCSRGHEYSGVDKRGYRVCHTCHRMAKDRYQKRVRSKENKDG